MHRDTAALNFTHNWKEYWALPLVIILHLIILTYQSNYKSFNVSTSPTIEQTTRMKVSLQKKPKQEDVVQIRKSFKRKKKLKKKQVVQKLPPKQTKQASANKSIKKIEALEVAKKNFKSLLKNYSRPEYPRRELRRGVTGSVILQFLVKGNGEVVRVSVAKSSGNGALDLSAFQAAKKWKFKDLGFSSQQVLSLARRVVFNIN